MTCEECLHYDVCYHIEHYGRLTETEEPCGGFKNKVDFVKVGVFQDWLNEIAFNNVGIDDALVSACIEIISRLDGLRIFARERRNESGGNN